MYKDDDFARYKSMEQSCCCKLRINLPVGGEVGDPSAHDGLLINCFGIHAAVKGAYRPGGWMV